MEQQNEDGPIEDIKEWWEGRFRRRGRRKGNRNNKNDGKSCTKKNKAMQGKPRCSQNANKRY